MVFQLLSDGTRKARKDHYCEGRDQIDRHGEEALECKGIKKGDEYDFQTNVTDDGIATWHSCKPCHDFIKKHQLYEDY